MNNAYANDKALGCRTAFYPDAQSIRESAFPANVPIASFDGSWAYLNRDGGWAYSAQGVQRMIDMVIAKGGKVLSGQGAVELVRKDGRTIGVKLSDGTVYGADLIVLAAGPWTASTFPDLALQGKCLATGYA